MKPRLLLRPDAAPALGAGHLMRAVSLADAAVLRGAEPHIAVGPDAGALADLATEHGHAVHHLAAAVGSAGDARETARVAGSLGARACIVDGYRFDTDYLLALRGRALTVALIDDLGRAGVPVDLIVNPNFGAHRGDLRGTRYVMLRREFFAHAAGPRPRRRGRRPLRLLVTFGGSDPTRGAARILDLLPADAPVVATAVIGPGYRDDGELARAARAAAGRGHIIELARNVADMASLIAMADAAVCAAGTVLWELAYLGCPTAAFVVAGNQHDVGTALAHDGYVLGGRWLLDTPDAQITELLAELTGDAVARMHLARRFCSLVDGAGAARVLDAVDAATGRRREIAA